MKTRRYKIVLTSMGGTEHAYMCNLSYAEALDICERGHWEVDTGYVWDMEIREDDE